MTKSEVFSKIFHKEDLEKLKNHTWHWHSSGSKNSIKAPITAKGLLFFMKNNIWNVKYN
jgi:hypothetical protein